MRAIGSQWIGAGGGAMGRRILAAAMAVGAAAPFAFGSVRVAQVEAREDRFIIYYGREPTEALRSADIAVLDAEAPRELLLERPLGSLFLGYVSLAEVNAGRPYFAEIEAAGVLLGRQPAWPDAWFVDMRAEAWRRMILERIVPDILARGFDGIFIDTLDDAEHLEASDGERFGGMVAAAAGLVRDIRKRFPTQPIMINRGYAVLPLIVGQFDMLLGESVRARHEGPVPTYRLLPEQDYAWQRDRMWEARRRQPSLRLFSLDYWDPADGAGIARLYSEQRRNGFVPYVATPDLTRIIPPPSERSP